MTTTERSSRADRDLMSAAGWLFADLLLVLVVMVLGTDVATPRSAEHAPEELQRELGMETEPIVIEFDTLGPVMRSTDPVGEWDRLTPLVAGALDHHGIADRRAGIVLTFANAPDVAQGNAIAAGFNRMLSERFPSLFEDSALRTFRQAARPEGRVRAEIYLLETEDDHRFIHA